MIAVSFQKGVLDRRLHVASRALGWLLIAACGACVPSRGEQFAPVRSAVHARSGLSAEWRSGSSTAAVERRTRQWLAQPLNARAAARIAVARNPELQAAYAELGVTSSEAIGLGPDVNPELEAHVTFPVRSGDEDGAHLEFSVLEDVTALLAAGAQARLASAEVAAARRRATATTLDVAAAAMRRYYDAVAAEQQLKLRRVFAETAQAAAELARGLRAAGNVTEFERLRETVLEEEAELGLRQAEAAAADAREALAVALGLGPEERDFRLVGEFDALPDAAPNVRDLERVALARNLELEALRYALQAADHGVSLARLESFVPHIGVGVAVKREEDWRLGPALSLSLPLLDFGAAKRGAASARLEGLRQHYLAAEAQTRGAARSLAVRLAAAHERALRLKTRVLPMRAQLLEQAMLQYNAMTLDAFVLLSIRREQAGAQERYVDALREYWITQGEVEWLRAGALPRERPLDAGGASSSSGESISSAGQGH
jgi:outer membrane protein TolC